LELDLLVLSSPYSTNSDINPSLPSDSKHLHLIRRTAHQNQNDQPKQIQIQIMTSCACIVPPSPWPTNSDIQVVSSSADPLPTLSSVVGHVVDANELSTHSNHNTKFAGAGDGDSVDDKLLSMNHAPMILSLVESIWGIGEEYELIKSELAEIDISMISFGRINYDDGGIYTGNFLKGEPFGFGHLHYPGDVNYIGYFFFGVEHGKGTLIWNNGQFFHGKFKNGTPDGNGFQGSVQNPEDYNFLDYPLKSITISEFGPTCRLEGAKLIIT
jgi:hypothetical protein